MPYCKAARRGWIGGVALSLVALTQSAHAQIVTSTFTQTGSLYNYFYAVTNNTLDSLALVTLNLPNPITLSNFSAPTGFSVSAPDGATDPTTTLVSFFPNGATPDFSPNTTVGNFGFSTPTQLGAVPYSITSSNPNTPNANGTTTAIAAPEASPLVLTLLGGACLGLYLTRRRALLR